MNRYRVLAGVLLLAGMFLVFSSAALAAPVGTVTAVQGKADITRGDDPARPVALDDEVFVGDFLRTKSGGRLEVTFVDGSVSSMSSRSRLRVTEFLFDAGKREGKLDLLRGKMRSVVADVSPDSAYEVHTPTAVCGVRGTQFIVTFQNGVTRGATVSGTVYTYSRNRPGEVRVMEAGQGFTLTDPDDAPQVRDIPEGEMQRDLDDTSMGGDGDGGDDGNGGTSGTVGDDLASGDDGTSGTTPPDGSTGGLDPGSDPNAPPTIPTEPEPEPIIPESPAADSALSGSVSDAYSSTSFDALFDAETLTGTVTLSGTIKAPSDESGYGYSDPGWIVPLYFDNDTGTLDGMFAGKTGSWEGLVSSIFLDGDGNPFYLFGLPAGDTATAAGGGIELGEGAGFATLTPTTDMPEESSFGVVETEESSPYPLSIMIGDNYSFYYSGSEGESFYIDSSISWLDQSSLGSIYFYHDYFDEGGTDSLYSDGSAAFSPLTIAGVVGGGSLPWQDPPQALSLYSNGSGQFLLAAHEIGILGGVAPVLDGSIWSSPYLAMGVVDQSLTSANYLWNTTNLFYEPGFVLGESPLSEDIGAAYTVGFWCDDETLFGRTYGIYRDADGTAGFLTGLMEGYYFPDMDMWKADQAGTVISFSAYDEQDYSAHQLTEDMFSCLVSGGTESLSGSGTGTVMFLDDGNRGAPWGVYNIAISGPGNTFSAHDNTLYFGGASSETYRGIHESYFLSSVAVNWTPDGTIEIDGSPSMIDMAYISVGSMTYPAASEGSFYGLFDDDDGTWIGAAAGSFNGEYMTLIGAVSPDLPAQISLYTLDGGFSNPVTHESGLMGSLDEATFFEYANPASTYYMAMGTYDTPIDAGNYLWNTESFIYRDINRFESAATPQTSDLFDFARTFTVGLWETGTAVIGSTYGLYVSEGVEGPFWGLLGGPSAGNFYPGIDMWMASGENNYFDQLTCSPIENSFGGMQEIGLDLFIFGYRNANWSWQPSGQGYALRFSDGGVPCPWGTYNLNFSDSLTPSGGLPSSIPFAGSGSGVSLLGSLLPAEWNANGIVSGSLAGIVIDEQGRVGMLHDGGLQNLFGLYDQPGTVVDFISSAGGIYEEWDPALAPSTTMFDYQEGGFTEADYIRDPYTDITAEDPTFVGGRDTIINAGIALFGFESSGTYNTYEYEFPPDEWISLLSTNAYASITTPTTDLTGIDRMMTMWGTKWSGGVVEADATGAWVNWDDAVTGVSGGALAGTFDAVSETWTAATRGVALATPRFMQLATDESTLGGRDILAKLNIPFVRVGEVTFEGTNENITIANMNVKFFSYADGTFPRIWAANSLDGTYMSTPSLGDMVSLTDSEVAGPAFDGTLDFSVARWNETDLTWGANITGGGYVYDIQGGPNYPSKLTGAAAGRINTVAGAEPGAFTGTASGVAVPTTGF